MTTVIKLDLRPEVRAYLKGLEVETGLTIGNIVEIWILDKYLNAENDRKYQECIERFIRRRDNETS